MFSEISNPKSQQNCLDHPEKHLDSFTSMSRSGAKRQAASKAVATSSHDLCDNVLNALFNNPSCIAVPTGDNKLTCHSCSTDRGGCRVKTTRVKSQKNYCDRMPCECSKSTAPLYPPPVPQTRRRRDSAKLSHPTAQPPPSPSPPTPQPASPPSARTALAFGIPSPP